MSERRYFLIIGNGIAGATTAETLNAEDPQAEIMVIADDPCPVYYRPALKDYLGGKVREDKLWARPIDFYPSRNIRFLTDLVVGIDPKNHTVQTRGEQTIPYTRLLLAHGAKASALRCPGAQLSGVHTLRTIADYQQVLGRFPQLRRAVVTGSGTLALESIETLRHRGYAVTHLLRRRSLWSDVLDPVASDLVLQQEQRDGVDTRYEQEIQEIIGKNGQVTGVITSSGTHIACELVLLGIGIDPLTDFVKAAGIACGRGVKIDDTMQTNVPDIYAAGDLVETADPLTGKARVIGQWFPAIQQARAAAYSMLNLLDQSKTYLFGNFYNASMLYGLDFASVGLSTIPKNGEGYQELQAAPQPRQYQKVILKHGRPVGMLGMGDRSSVLKFKRAIDHQVDLSSISHKLFDPTFQLDTWMDEQGVPKPVLGVKRIPKAGKYAPATSVEKGNIPLRGALSQPDGSLLLPGGKNVLPQKMFTRLKQGPTLVFTTKDGPQIYPLHTQHVQIGRDPQCEIHLQDMSVSRHHAEIFYAQDGYYVRDLGSSNGVQVNKTRIENPYRLTTGDNIAISNNTIYFTAPAQASVIIKPSPTREAEKTSRTTAVAQSPKKECPYCHGENPAQAQFCANCGKHM